MVGVEIGFGLEEVLTPLLRAGQVAVATHFDAEEEGTRHRRACVPLSLRQRRRPATAILSILILPYVVVRLRYVERSGAFLISNLMMLIVLSSRGADSW